MRNLICKITESVALFFIFGVTYFIIECIWKGKVTDYRMAILGGCLGVIIGLLNNVFSYETDLILQCIVGSLIITLSEAIGGTYWNDMGLHIWDYSSLPFSAVHGTINLFFSFAWAFLSCVAILIDDVIRYKLFHEIDCPRYTIHGKVIYKMKRRK